MGVGILHFIIFYMYADVQFDVIILRYEGMGRVKRHVTHERPTIRQI